jgi:hypothetical protein
MPVKRLIKIFMTFIYSANFNHLPSNVLSKLMKNVLLDYSEQLLESSSTQNLAQNSEYRVLDTRLWNH